MLDADRADERLIVSRGPSTFYQALTYGWLIVIVAAVVFSLYGLTGGDGAMLARSAMLGGPLLVMAVLVHGWCSTEYRIDRRAGLLIVARTGPARAERRREVPLASVSALVDRRSSDGRAIEIVLADRSALVVARARTTASSALDAIAGRVSEILQKPLQLGRGMLIADRFEIDRLVQRGGMGVVYRAFDRTTGRPVALKLILAPTADRERSLRFAREIELLAKLDHPRIARYVAHGTASDGQAFLAMQWLDGEDLGVVLAEGALTPENSLRVLLGAAEAVAAVHGQGVIHRDLKPSNLFLRGGSPSDLLLLDFGVARYLESDTRLTGSTALVGTPHYMAPEQASSAREISPAADVFSLGCIFYECLTARHPFDAPQLAGVLARILFDTPEPVTSLNPAVPEAWSALLSRMLAKKPVGRPADARELLNELRRLPAADAVDMTRTGATSAGTAAEPDAGDQVLVCVVLATAPRSGGAPDAESQRLESIKSAMDRFGCPIERLLDGSLLATIMPQHSATDLVRVAARCALYLREQMPEARFAIATGRAPLRRAPHVGDAVDRAAHLLGLDISGAHEAIRVDPVTAGLLEGRFVTASHDGTHLLLGEKADLQDTRLLLGRPTPCVGRDLELLQLEGLATSALEEATPKAALVVGPPGIGKSRLFHELLRRTRERFPRHTSLIGYGDPLSAGSPYVLLSDALRRHAGIRVGDEPAQARAAIVEKLCRHVASTHVPRVSEFLGELTGVPFPDAESPPLLAARSDHRVMSEQIALAFGDWVAAECAAQPVVLVLDDVQWGDALTMKLLEGVLRDAERGAFFVIALGRPEMYETFPSPLGAQPALSLSLRPLSNKASELLVKGVLGDLLGEESLARIVRLASGNALFLEELIRAAAEGKAGDVPETILAMLQARLSRLSYEARVVLRAASILGESFWPGGVRRISEAWGAGSKTDESLAHLVDLEVVEPLRNSRFVSETEYAFRHALVCEAARGLVTESDRRMGHLAARTWLESAGETDAVVLARHAEEGGDSPRAIAFYTRAAEQSLAQHDFGAARVLVNKAMAGGAQGEALGLLRGIETAAFYNQGQWKEAAATGLSALELVPRGGVVWCSTVETLMQVLPNVNEFERCESLSDELLKTEPAPEARTAYVRALAVQLLGCAISGARARGQACLDFIDQLGVEERDKDIVARGYVRLWRSIFTFIVGNDLPRALSQVEQAIRDLTESQVMYRLSLAYTVLSFTLWGLGEVEKSESAARRGMAIAEEIHDDYHAAVAAWYLGLTLSEQPDPAKLDEAIDRAGAMSRLQESAIFEATSKNVIARAALTKKDWTRAEHEARASRERLGSIPPYRLFATATLLDTLVHAGRDDEAAAIAREDLALLAKMGSPVCSEVTFLVAAAEALFHGGARDEGHRVLRDALVQIDLRAATLSDPTMKARFLAGRPENRRAAELAASWFGVPA